MTGVSQISFKFVTAIRNLAQNDGRMSDLANSQDVESYLIYMMKLSIFGIFK